MKDRERTREVIGPWLVPQKMSKEMVLREAEVLRAPKKAAGSHTGNPGRSLEPWVTSS